MKHKNKKVKVTKGKGSTDSLARKWSTEELMELGRS